MCGTCGCGDKAETRIVNLQTGAETALDRHVRSQAHEGDADHHHDHEHVHVHPNDHAHYHAHGHAQEHHLDHAHDHDGHEHHDHQNSGDHDRDHHDHSYHHGEHHEHEHGDSSVVELEAQILAKNNALAAVNRGWFAGREILALNLVSSPGG